MENLEINAKKDYRYLKTAISLGYRSIGHTWPNPSVGCVIVKNNHIVGTGSTAFRGRPHAEKIALDQAKSEAFNSTVYVTLEPCSHFGKTDPCTTELIKAKVSRVVCPLKDPDPRVNGKGFEILRKHGIIVDNSPILFREIKDLNQGFIKSIEEKRPYIALKLAMSLNGKIATQTNKSNWISGERSRNFVQLLRSQYDAIIIGTGTAFWDNPRLNLRDQFLDLPQPVKIIIDKDLKLSNDLDLTKSKNDEQLFFVHDLNLEKDKIKSMEFKGIKTIGVSTLKNGYLNLNEMFQKLSKLGLTRILVEGGGKLATSLIEFKLVDKLILFTAGIILDKNAIDGFQSSISNIINLDSYNRYSLEKSLIIGNDIVNFWDINNYS
ncbi:MAG: bifunctional diaminohydroxyphosphoribosylaminopyrimidine deaminase/5-amino-6-(5-phosphoribosylamino)uracil reductase RibD [Paracoccaceae bacterium]